MNEEISHSGNLLPGNGRKPFPDVGGDMFDRFTDNFQAAEDGILGLAPLKKILGAQLLGIFLNNPNGL